MKDITTTMPENALPARTPAQSAIAQSARSILSGISVDQPTQTQPGQFEQEADRAAESVENNRKPSFSFSNLSLTDRLAEEDAGGEPAVEDQESEKEPSAVQDVSLMRKPIIAAEQSSGAADEANGYHGRAAFGLQGQPLDPSTRRSMEASFGFNFGNVRIHTGGTAEESAKALDAHAFTVGQNIVFGKNEYAPSSERGRRLLSHELAHTVQQQRGGGLHQKRLHKAEYGTYVSLKGDKPYLDAGAEYYKTWGFPNVQRVTHIKDVLDDLDKSKKPIDTFRIVSHGNFSGLELGNVQGLESQPTEGLDMKDWFTKKGTEFSEEARFRKHYIDEKNEGFVSESFFNRIIKDTRKKDATMGAILKRLGAEKDVPALGTPTGIVLRALTDRFYLGEVKSDTGGAVRFKNRAVLDEFIDRRLTAFRSVAVQGAAAAKQPDVEKAFTEYEAALPTAFSGAGLKFTALTDDDAKTFADTYLQSTTGKAALKTDIKTALTEGAPGGGPFLKKLQSVRTKINSATHIEIRGCNVGEDTATLDSFRNFFGTPKNIPSISAPDLYQYFFRLNYVTYTKSPRDQANLEGVFNTPDTGVGRAFEDLRRQKAGEMMRVINEPTLDALATKYGFKQADLVRWNPQILDGKKIAPGDEVWLVMRPEVPAGKYKTLKDFAKNYVGNDKALGDLKTLNTQIADPDALSQIDVIKIPKAWQTAKVASPASTAADFTKAIRGGQLVTGIDASTTTSKPISHMDNTKADQTIGAWLEKQKFDPKGRTAAQLSALYAGRNFSRKAATTYINFLSRSYPTIEDAVFPEDQRYDKHIIRRP